MLKAIHRGEAIASWFGDHVIVTWKGKDITLYGAAHKLLQRKLLRTKELLFSARFEGYYPHWRATLSGPSECGNPNCKATGQYCIYS